MFSNSFEHRIHHILEPKFQIAWLEKEVVLVEIHGLPFGTDHFFDEAVIQTDAVDVLEKLFEVNLYEIHIFAVLQYVNQVVVGQKVKAREWHALRL